MVITATGDEAAIALGRVAQSSPLPFDTLDRLANFAAARTDVDGRVEIIRGLAKQWLVGTPSRLAATIRDRLLSAGSQANRRAFEVEVARAALMGISKSERELVLNQLVDMWRLEVEPVQRIALAAIIGS